MINRKIVIIGGFTIIFIAIVSAFFFPASIGFMQNDISSNTTMEIGDTYMVTDIHQAEVNDIFESFGLERVDMTIRNIETNESIQKTWSDDTTYDLSNIDIEVTTINWVEDSHASFTFSYDPKWNWSDSQITLAQTLPILFIIVLIFIVGIALVAGVGSDE